VFANLPSRSDAVRRRENATAGAVQLDNGGCALRTMLHCLQRHLGLYFALPDASPPSHAVHRHSGWFWRTGSRLRSRLFTVLLLQDAFRKIARHEGPAALWRGLAPTLFVVGKEKIFFF
jgi:hypothetical protein